MATNNFNKSNLEYVYNIIQHSMIVFPKEIVLAVLKDFFSHDQYYKYNNDEWGFAKTPDHTDLPLGAGINDNLTTRIFIGENYRQDIIYYPSILIKSNGSKYVPISINRNQGTIQYKKILYDDGYGNLTEISRPEYFVTAGAWEGSLTIDVKTRSLRSCDDICQLVAMALTEIYFDQLVESGLIIKPLNIGGVSTTEDRNDKLFTQSITLDIRNEYRREIPIETLIESVLFSIEFDDLSQKYPSPAINLNIDTSVTLSNIF
ncbi:MAG: hypothetical protein LC122_13150 [Chitinophagales bacterium]|nr:hypothetical protein [Chitinophagales bacterium]